MLIYSVQASRCSSSSEMLELEVISAAVMVLAVIAVDRQFPMIIVMVMIAVMDVSYLILCPF